MVQRRGRHACAATSDEKPLCAQRGRLPSALAAGPGDFCFKLFGIRFRRRDGATPTERGGAMITRDQSALLAPVQRDVRLDLFRGLGLWMIFLDHIPHDVVAWLTLRNYGFSDAAEFFVFISGYLVGWIYGPIVAGG